MQGPVQIEHAHQNIVVPHAPAIVGPGSLLLLAEPCVPEAAAVAPEPVATAPPMFTFAAGPQPQTEFNFSVPVPAAPATQATVTDQRSVASRRIARPRHHQNGPARSARAPIAERTTSVDLQGYVGRVATNRGSQSSAKETVDTEMRDVQ